MAHVLTTPWVGANDAASVSTAGISDGMMLLLAIRSPETNNAVSSYGFALLGTATCDGDAARPDELKIYWKVASSEPGSYSLTQGGGNNLSFSGILQAFSGRTGTPQIVVTDDAPTASASPTSVTLTGDTAAAGDDVSAIMALSNVTTAGTWTLTTVPGSYTDRGGQSDIGTFTGGFVGSATRDNTSGATGNLTLIATRSGGTGHGEGFGAVIRLAQGAVLPTITSIDSDDAVFAGQTGVVIAGTGFGSTQGTGRVVISPADDIDDAGAVAQTVTAWGATSITITVVKGSLSLDTPVYLFVENDADDSNAAGHEMEIQSRPYVRETLIDLNGAAVASEASIVMLVWRQNPTTGAPNPDQALSVSTNGTGEIDQVITRGALDVDDPVWVAFVKDGTPARGTMRKVTPVYE